MDDVRGSQDVGSGCAGCGLSAPFLACLMRTGDTWADCGLALQAVTQLSSQNRRPGLTGRRVQHRLKTCSAATKSDERKGRAEHQTLFFFFLVSVELYKQQDELECLQCFFFFFLFQDEFTVSAAAAMVNSCCSALPDEVCEGDFWAAQQKKQKRPPVSTSLVSTVSSVGNRFK